MQGYTHSRQKAGADLRRLKPSRRCPAAGPAAHAITRGWRPSYVTAGPVAGRKTRP